MAGSRNKRLATVFALSAVLGACAAAPSPWQAHEAAVLVKSIDVERAVCPVVLSNQTGEQVAAGYVSNGVEAQLGYLPSGQSLEFRVACKVGGIEAFAETTGGFFEGMRYRKMARLDLGKATRLQLTQADRIR